MIENWSRTTPGDIKLIEDSIENGKFPFVLLSSVTMTQMWKLNPKNGKHEGNNFFYVTKIDSKNIYGAIVVDNVSDEVSYSRNRWYIERLDLDDYITEEVLMILKIK